ncbi:hypothetical protein BHE74_00001727 [Ensete ventricosum]|nr:hypothetical protein GW17_00053142 [Ensete ventricosum]RWW89336.1 hypothetical protein BHE74_00001727 [Ensete ventricosum]
MAAATLLFLSHLPLQPLQPARPLLLPLLPTACHRCYPSATYLPPLLCSSCAILNPFQSLPTASPLLQPISSSATSIAIVASPYRCHPLRRSARRCYFPQPLVSTCRHGYPPVTSLPPLPQPLPSHLLPAACQPQPSWPQPLPSPFSSPPPVVAIFATHIFLSLHLHHRRCQLSAPALPSRHLLNRCH